MQDQIPALYSVCNTTATWSHNSHHLQSVLITLWLTLSYKHSHTQHIKSTKLHLMVFLCWKTKFLYAHCTQMHARTPTFSLHSHTRSQDVRSQSIDFYWEWKSLLYITLLSLPSSFCSFCLHSHACCFIVQTKWKREGLQTRDDEDY